MYIPCNTGVHKFRAPGRCGEYFLTVGPYSCGYPVRIEFWRATIFLEKFCTPSPVYRKGCPDYSYSWYTVCAQIARSVACNTYPGCCASMSGVPASVPVYSIAWPSARHTVDTYRDTQVYAAVLWAHVYKLRMLTYCPSTMSHAVVERTK
jgi:hypothetical protein